MEYKKFILNELLDKFERSKTYLDENKLNRRISIKICPSFSDYIENTGIKERVNYTILDLAEKGIIQYEWMKHEKDNIIDKVWLNLDKIDIIYKEAGRIPKKTEVHNVLTMIGEAKANTSELWIKKFLEDAELSIDAKKDIKPFFPDDSKMAKALLDALNLIDEKKEEEYLERVFSLKCFKDSKFFEKNLKKKVIGIIKRYLLKGDTEEYTDEEILAQIGIVKTPEQIDFCGNIIGIINGHREDFSIFKRGITINSYTAREIIITDLKSINKVLFIENKANYIDYIFKKRGENELVMFHGGFYSPVKGLFFKKVYEAGYNCSVEFYHWGDIDAGGFKIFNRLKNNIIPGLKPYLMDREAFLSKKDYWAKFDANYRNILKEMRNKEDLKEFCDVIDLMLKENAKLEQEAFLL